MARIFSASLRWKIYGVLLISLVPLASLARVPYLFQAETVDPDHPGLMAHGTDTPHLLEGLDKFKSKSPTLTGLMNGVARHPVHVMSKVPVLPRGGIGLYSGWSNTVFLLDEFAEQTDDQTAHLSLPNFAHELGHRLLHTANSRGTLMEEVFCYHLANRVGHELGSFGYTLRPLEDVVEEVVEQYGKDGLPPLDPDFVSRVRSLERDGIFPPGSAKDAALIEGMLRKRQAS